MTKDTHNGKVFLWFDYEERCTLRTLCAKKSKHLDGVAKDIVRETSMLRVKHLSIRQMEILSNILLEFGVNINEYLDFDDIPEEVKSKYEYRLYKNLPWKDYEK